MARCGKGFKERAVARLLPPASTLVETVSREPGILVVTLERWCAPALAEPRQERRWTAAARLEAMITTASMDKAAKSAWCREQGIYPSTLERWRQSAALIIGETGEVVPSRWPEADRAAWPYLLGGGIGGLRGSGEHARERLITKFSLEATVERYERLYLAQFAADQAKGRI